MDSDERTPLMRRISAIVPTPVAQPGIEKLEVPVSLPQETIIPPPSFTAAIQDVKKGSRPQCISHRGYKAKFPENTLLAFQEAVKVGTNGLETDVHLTKDDIVVLSHDKDLKRCFGQKEILKDCTWDEIKDLRTLAEPHVPMPRLRDLLEYLTQPELEEIWLLLDVKLDNDAERIMRLMASAIAEVKPPASKPWENRIVLGLWAAKYLPLAAQYFPGYPVMHIGISVSYARHFFTVPEVGFNMLMPLLIGPGGKKFIRDRQTKYNRKLLAWTVNSPDRMKWCIRRKLDGVITDDPKLFLQVRDNFDEQARVPWIPVGFMDFIDLARIWLLIAVMFRIFFKKLLSPVASPELIKRVPQSSAS